MPVVAVLAALAEDKKKLLGLLQAISEKVRQQRRIFREGKAEELASFSRKKKELADRLHAVMSHIQEMAKRPAADEKKEVAALLGIIKKESLPLIRMIMQHEKQDEPFFLAMKQDLSTELRDIEKAKSRLKDVRASYISGYVGDQKMYDQTG